MAAARGPRPATEVRPGLTKYALLKAAAISHKQFTGYLKWGLIPESEEGRWPEGTVDRLLEIRNAEDKARRLERRGVLLGVQDPEKRRRAMVALAKIMKARTLKTRRFLRGGKAISAKPNPFADQAFAPPPPPMGWRFPDPVDWPVVLNDKDSWVHFDLASRLAYLSSALLPNDKATPLALIPREELVLLLTIQELSQRAHKIKATLRTNRKP